MAVNITTTQQTAENIRILGYGESGIGKTRLIQTAPKPLIASSEKKAYSLRHSKIPFLPIESFEHAKEEFNLLAGEKGKPYRTICIDSITHLAEMVLAECQQEFGDGRQVYGELAKRTKELIELVFAIPNKHVYMIAKIIRQEDEFTNLTTWCPAMPGQTLTRDLPYYFDLFFPLREWVDENGKTWGYLQTESDVQYRAKGDRSCLDSKESPDLTKLFNKILRRENA